MDKTNPKYYLYSNSEKIFIDNDDVFYNTKSILEEKDLKDPLTLKNKAQEYVRNRYSEILKSSAFKNLIVLTGAGASTEGAIKISGDSSGDDRLGLWTAAKEKLGENKFKALLTQIQYDESQTDIEEFLTKAYLHLKLNNSLTIKYKSEEEGKDIDISLQDLIKEIEASIVDECNLQINGDIQEKFLNKLINRNLKLPRVKYFTTNYDTLIEQAAQNCGITLIDGFSFTMPRTFSGRNFDFDIVYRDKSRIKNEESFVPKVLHLYKMHGSLDWERNKDKIIIGNSSKDKKLIIYPASNKYESSYEQPYFEMMSRFQNYLRQENTLLIIIGFSLYDKHISNVILEAVNQNPSFTLLIFNYYIDKKTKDLEIPLDDKYLHPFINKENVYIINEKFSDLASNYPSNKVYSDTNTSENEI